ncbi:MAG: thioredoxin family protein [Candidatus Bathyarchaeia archaeon]
MELKVFTLPTCSSCPAVKVIARDIAEKFGFVFREVNLATEEGLREGLAYNIMSVPSIVLGDEVIAKGQVLSKERLEMEIAKRIEKWEKSL